jgi:hypothetical protein
MQIMEFIVKFVADGEIVQLTEEDVLLDQFEAYSLDDWCTVDTTQPILLKCLYNDDIYKAWLLQVVDKRVDTSVAIERYRSWSEKKKPNISTLLKGIGRVRKFEEKRERRVPMKVSR